MTIERVVCENCKQTGFANTLKLFHGKQVCHECYDKLFGDRYSWGNVDNLAIKFMIGSNFTDYDEVYVPLESNLMNATILDDGEYDTLLAAFNALISKWSEMDIAYGNGDWHSFELVERPELSSYEEVKDDELWDLWIYKEMAYMPEFYSRPFDKSPAELYFVSYFTAECYKGSIYSIDFGYYHCDSCERDVCGQNPANGWHSQVHIHDGWVECNKCYEERTLRDGINEDFDDNIPGQFFNEADIQDNGWAEEETSVLAGSGYSGYADPNNVINKIRRLIDSGKKVLVNYDSMAIGGLGGYVSLYTKD